jgi:1,4-dihydroxy-2-naphthoate octaprenyltransferase
MTSSAPDTVEPRPSLLRAWWLALRPATLPAGAVPVVVGTAVAAHVGGWRPVVATLALAGALLLQIGSNLVNDAADFAKGADTADRLGPARATQRGWLSARQVWAGAWLAFGAATLCGFGLIAEVAAAGHTWVVVTIGLASIAGAVLYTAGKKPLGYLGLGDLMVFVYFGPVAVCGTAGLQLGHLPAAAVWAAVPVGALATAILVVNNLRDREGDARAGKRTLVVRFGPQVARRQYAALVVVASLMPAVGAMLHALPKGAWLTSLSLPLAVGCVRAIHRDDGRALNPWLGRTARLELAHGALFAIGVWPCGW